MSTSTRDKLRALHALHADGLLDAAEFERRQQALLDAEYAPSQLAAAGPRAGTDIGLMAGMEIGPESRRYRLERQLAVGGMAQVWAALDLATLAQLGRSELVALKILEPQWTHSPALARLLVEEATQARRLAHEHIVRVYDWAQDPATSSYFLIMEYLDGEDLASLLAREGPLPLARALALLQPVAEALDYAWERQQLVHRDLKPANLFITRAGQVKLLDFGIAAPARSATAGQAGTAGYRAPETVGGRSLPAQRVQDVYGAAALLHVMLTARLPQAGDPAPPGLNARQWAVLQTALAAAPAQRPPSVSTLLAELARTGGPSADQLAAQHAAARAAEEERARAAAAAAAQATATAQAAARARQQQEQAAARAAQAEAKAAAAARKEALRRQLAERRALALAQARAAQEAQARQQLQAKAAAAYRAEQERARQALAERSAAELAAQLPAPSSPTADAAGVLRDLFQDGSGHGPELVLIPTGRFQMGSHYYERELAAAAGSDSALLARETPPHWVGVQQALALGRYPVTRAEWDRFAREQGQAPVGGPGRLPVTGVSWAGAQAYCRWLSAQTGQHYRLPSEAEWEYACRAGSKQAYSWGETITPAQACYAAAAPVAVGQYGPNAWGLFDMHGNVWEWVQDPLHADYSGAPLEASVWEQGGDARQRVLRGGSWRSAAPALRSASRAAAADDTLAVDIGFRVARSLG
ncbi:bifunctional serine/threonine-protein kinase/formylglycine-generating enzyme family protein [Massilia sp. TS11]|uniref:bifunctional serine/threonine-protein kinase/formylglycine-generating enzyme family protein n=1 Tax=Massilia sp. TS11 TaxID=2908003 RepID=UPI001EDC7EC1|nr:bifunctional serine/threonine-protein kinase/formylglycine-generating enzyme family protein [Massilia sp. TS11]MCG2584517.1 bifunctional serine/threonine-protein kinase/formylglycine-generating enzyme family protein [Massilia sp. TS11]